MKISEGNISEDDIEYEKQQLEQEQRRIELETQAITQRNKKIQQEKAEYKLKLEHERLELLKQKQGIIPEEAVVIHEEKAVILKPKGIKAIENFWYQYNVYIILVLVFFLIGSFLVYNIATTEKADVNILVVPNENSIAHTESLETLIEKYSPDVNGDGKIHTSVILIPIKSKSANPNTDVANQTKLLAELQAGKTMLIIANENLDQDQLPVEYMKDLRAEYPNNPKVDRYGFKLDSDMVKKVFGWENMPDGMYIGIRTPQNVSGTSQEKAQKQYDISKAILDKVIAELSEK